ncbi:unnamed protein product [Closterium sp. Naga37s-1]|nr:unnamed protein product [Closterium sp. Naga37s-1]
MPLPQTDHGQANASAPSVEAMPGIHTAGDNAGDGDGGEEGDGADHAAGDSGAADASDRADGADGGGADAFTLLLDDAVSPAGFQADRLSVTESEGGVVGEEEAYEWARRVVRSGMEAEVEQGGRLLETQDDAEGGEEGAGERGGEGAGEDAAEDLAAGEVVPEERRQAEQGINLTHAGRGAMEDQSSARQLSETESNTARLVLTSTDTSSEAPSENSPSETLTDGSGQESGEEQGRDVDRVLSEVGGAGMEGPDGGSGYMGMPHALGMGRSSSGISDSNDSTGSLGSGGDGWDRSASGYGRGSSSNSSSSSSSSSGGGAAVWDAMLMEALSPLPRGTLVARPFTMQRRLSEVEQEATDGPASPTLSPSLSLTPDPFQVFSRSTYRPTFRSTTRTSRVSRVSRSSHTSRTNNTSRTSRTSYGTVLFPAVFSPALSGRPDSSSDHRGWSSPATSNGHGLTRAASSGATGAADWAARGSGGESGRGSGGWGWGGSEGRGSGAWGMGEVMGEGMGERIGEAMGTEGGAGQLPYEELLLLDEGIAPRGLTPRELWGLDRLTVTHADVHSHPDCQICLSSPVEGDLLANLPCHHTFHNACITTWFARNRTCPLCRFEIATTS